MTTRTRKPPGITAGLGKDGKAMVEAVLADLRQAQLEPDAREAALLKAAGELRDRMSLLEKLIDKEGAAVAAATGTRMHPAVPELRQYAVALARVLSGVSMADLTGSGRTKAAAKVRAAQTRWARQEARNG